MPTTDNSYAARLRRQKGAILADFHRLYPTRREQGVGGGGGFDASTLLARQAGEGAYLRESPGGAIVVELPCGCALCETEVIEIACGEAVFPFTVCDTGRTVIQYVNGSQNNSVTVNVVDNGVTTTYTLEPYDSGNPDAPGYRSPEIILVNPATALVTVDPCVGGG